MTDRPYSEVRTDSEALAEIRAYRATQSHPAVGDAFLEAFRKRPQGFAVDAVARAVA
jgi:HD-GYP domain-containing protein (c-di-GMP phosphodiesterase class II)